MQPDSDVRLFFANKKELACFRFLFVCRARYSRPEIT